MIKDEREILTRQVITKKLIYEAKRSMIGSLMICILAALLFGMLNIMWFGFSDVPSAIRIIINLLQLPVYLACAFFFIRGIINICKVNRDAFTVVEDILTEIEDNQLSLKQLILYGGYDILLGSKSHLRHIFKFRSGKVFIANAEEYKNTGLAAAAEFSSVGDSFFLVFYNDSPDRIILLFSSKIYNYKG